MSNTTKTLVTLVACVALTVPAWAYTLGCPDEVRNGCFEHAVSDFYGEDYGVSGFGGGETTPPQVDHWTLCDNCDWGATSDDPPYPNHTPGVDTGHSIKGSDCCWMWQIIDETEAPWYVDDNGWGSGTNTCWLDEGTEKHIVSEYWAWFTDTDQLVEYQVFAWTLEDSTPGASDMGCGWPSTDKWTKIGQTDGAATTVSKWQGFSMDVTLDTQPRYLGLVFHFSEEEGSNPFYIDDVRLEGECRGPGDAPELGTWLLLACTGALGGVIRRRRKT